MKAFTSLIFGAPLLLAAMVAGAPVAAAHSFPEREAPSAGQRLSAPPSEVTITFDAPIEKLFAKLEVFGANGKPETVGRPRLDPSARTLSVKLAALKPGNYTVKWGVVCIDSHHTEGSYVFTVVSGG
jgi:methionine-rich copper-binding protein CopC